MAQFLPHYINTDLQLPTEFNFDFGLGDYLWGLFKYHLEWTDVKYDQGTWDFVDVIVSISRKLNVPLIRVKFPAIKKWEITAN